MFGPGMVWGLTHEELAGQVKNPEVKKAPPPLRPSELLNITDWMALTRELGWPDCGEEQFWQRLDEWDAATSASPSAGSDPAEASALQQTWASTHRSYLAAQPAAGSVPPGGAGAEETEAG